MVGGGERDDAQETAETSAVPPVEDAATPVTEEARSTPTVRPASAAAAETTEVSPVRHRTRWRAVSRVRQSVRPKATRFWLPLVVVAVFLIAAALAGAVLVPEVLGADEGTPARSQAPTSEVPQSVPPTPTALPTTPTRPADALARWAGAVSAAASIPPVAVQAYGYAQLVMRRDDPTCHLGWTTLAGIGKVESDHGRAGGAVLQPGGRSTPPIVGPLLDGKDGRPTVADTDAGAFDGDATFDRAMGPLRLMPSMWRANAIDADADGILDAYDLDDSALALARLLCSGPEDMRTAAGWNAAVARYHAGAAYARTVFQAADDYGQRTRSIG